VQQHLPRVRMLRTAKGDTADSTQGDNPEWHPGDPGTLSAKVDVSRWRGEHPIVTVASPEAGYAVLRLMDYPAWQVTVDGKPEHDRPARGDGLMAVPVPPGSHTIEVQWATTKDVIAGRVVSATALLALAMVTMLERRQRRV
jgi:hypothetical protein